MNCVVKMSKSEKVGAMQVVACIAPTDFGVFTCRVRTEGSNARRVDAEGAATLHSVRPDPE